MTNYKSPIRIFTTDFKSGELDPMLAMRLNTDAFPSGSKALTNMLVSQAGPVMRRPGTKNLAKLASRSRLIEFEFDTDEKYVLAFQTNGVDFYDPSGVKLQSMNNPDFCAWGSDEKWEMTFIQKGDTMLIAHNDFKFRRIKRTSLTTFSIDIPSFSTDTGISVLNQPYYKYYPAAYTMAISSTSIGTGKTLECSHAIFTSAWVGERIRIYNCEIEITAFVNSTTMTARNRQKIETRLGIAPLRFTAGTKDVEITHVLHGLATGASVTLSGATEAFDLTKDELNGTYTITVIDEDRYQILVTATDTANNSGDGGGPSIRISTTDATRSWTEQVWSDRRGWPGAITLHENRLWLGGSRGNPTFMSGSAVGSYYDHNVRDGLDDESVQAQISQLTRIRHFVSSQHLQIFTEASEAIVETQQGEPITPGNLKVTTQTHYGASNVRPHLFDGATLFCQRQGRNIRELLYDYQTDSHVSSPVSITANHLISSPHDLAVLDGSRTRPEQYAFIVNDNGTVAIFHSIRNEKLAAWTPMLTRSGDEFDSVCAMGSSVYFSVLRNGDFYLERFELDEDDIWLDGCKQLSMGSTVTWPLGSAYANQAVDVMSRNNYLGRYTANGSGTVTLNQAVDTIVAGYNYPVSIIPNPPDKELTDGPMTGEIRRILSATVHWYETTAVAINGKEQILFNPISNPAVNAAKHSGKRRIRMLGYSGRNMRPGPYEEGGKRDPTFEIHQPTPGPMTVLGFTLEVSL